MRKHIVAAPGSLIHNSLRLPTKPCNVCGKLEHEDTVSPARNDIEARRALTLSGGTPGGLPCAAVACRELDTNLDQTHTRQLRVQLKT